MLTKAHSPSKKGFIMFCFIIQEITEVNYSECQEIYLHDDVGFEHLLETHW
jgi:hypothetical protein